jgi:hypothetical protein
VVARRRQGVCGDLEGVTGKVPDKEERAGSHRNGGSTVRRCKRRRAATFVGGEGAPVGGDGGCGVLQHRRGKGVSKLQENSGIGSSGRSSVGSGRRRRCSAGGGGPGAGSGGEARALERRGRRGVETGGRVEQRERGASGSVAARQRGKEEEKGGGPGVGVPCGAGVLWGLVPTGGRCPVVARARHSRVTCAARVLPAETERGETSDGWAVAQCRAVVLLIGGAGLSVGTGRARARVGWPKKKRRRAVRMQSKVLLLFELV